RARARSRPRSPAGSVRARAAADGSSRGRRRSPRARAPSTRPAASTRARGSPQPNGRAHSVELFARELLIAMITHRGAVIRPRLKSAGALRSLFLPPSRRIPPFERLCCMKLRVLFAVLGVSLVNARVARAQMPSFDHVIVIVMENQEYESIIGSADAPYINGLAQQYGLATNYFAVTHPSLPNYMALTSGDTFFTTDCVGCQTTAANLADRIEASGRSWTAYMEDMPAACSATDSGLYAAKHNPFVHYTDIVSNAGRCASHVVPFSNFSSDLANGRLS